MVNNYFQQNFIDYVFIRKRETIYGFNTSVKLVMLSLALVS